MQPELLVLRDMELAVKACPGACLTQGPFQDSSLDRTPGGERYDQGLHPDTAAISCALGQGTYPLWAFRVQNELGCNISKGSVPRQPS